MFCNVFIYERRIDLDSINCSQTQRCTIFGFNPMHPWEKFANKTIIITLQLRNWENSLYCRFVKSLVQHEKEGSEQRDDDGRWILIAATPVSLSKTSLVIVGRVIINFSRRRIIISFAAAATAAAAVFLYTLQHCRSRWSVSTILTSATFIASDICANFELLISRGDDIAYKITRGRMISRIASEYQRAI